MRQKTATDHDLLWNLAARTSVGVPVVGTGQYNALWMPSGSEAGWRSKLLTLPARLLRRLLLRRRLLDRLMDGFFFNVLVRTGSWSSSPAAKL